MAAGRRRLIVDLGTGDGRAAVLRAREDPNALVIGIDPVAEAMTETAARAARPVSRGGQANLLFVLAAAEDPPPELRERVALVTVTLPWGSLLRGTVGLDHRALAGIRTLLAPAGRLEALVSIADRDGPALGVPIGRLADVAAIADAWRGAGLVLESCEGVAIADVAAAGSTWAKRLRGGSERRVVRLGGRRANA